ncbi:hypothetical protein SEA_CIRCINUS_235 [Streptomyces phage Circinus]|uniref:Uncharacterized protein n=1 Tax=Streptomyces phage Circinus TaxID=2562189 RepID=A0A4D6E1J2_9CAUD|nr:hypothetical protein SEA_CIRCINUS_235 [Streptomyces phage Circinus]
MLRSEVNTTRVSDLGFCRKPQVRGGALLTLKRASFHHGLVTNTKPQVRGGAAP